MMSFKIPCGGFRLDEKSFSLDESGVLSVSGGGGSGGLFKVTITGTANESDGSYTYRSDKTGKEVYDAFMSGLLPYAELIVDGDVCFSFIPCTSASDQYTTEFMGVTAGQSTDNNGKILVSYFALQVKNTVVTYTAHILNGSVETNCGPFSTMFD